MGYSLPLFLYFLSIQLTVGNIKFVDDWIRTADLWRRKQPLYQLSHNICPLSNRYVWSHGVNRQILLPSLGLAPERLNHYLFIVPNIDFFKKNWPTRPLFNLLSSFQTHITIFTTNKGEKMSIQYTVPGFKPTTFGTWGSRPLFQI